MVTSFRRLASALVVVLALAISAAAQSPCSSSTGTACLGRLTLDLGWRVPYWRTYPLGTSNSRVTIAIVVVHGTDRNPDAYFGHAIEAALQERVLDSTLILAPHFQIEDDDPESDELFWSDGGWKQGDRALNGGLSSFTVVDRIIERLADRTAFPNLRRVVITGHSAGGQYTTRFAAGSRAQNGLAHLGFRYVIANPSSYLYLRSERPVLTDATMRNFRVPAVLSKTPRAVSAT